MASAVSSLLADISRIRSQQERLAGTTASEATTAKLAELKRQEQQHLSQLAKAAAEANDDQDEAQDEAEATAHALNGTLQGAAAGAADAATAGVAGAAKRAGAAGTAGAAGAANGAGPAPTSPAEAAASTSQAYGVAPADTTAPPANGAATAGTTNEERPAKRARSEAVALSADRVQLLQHFMAGGGLPESILGEPGPDAVQNAPLALMIDSSRLLEEHELVPAQFLPSYKLAPKGPFVVTEDMARKLDMAALAQDVRAELQSNGGSVGMKLPLGRLLKTQTLRNEAVQYVRKDVAPGHVLRTLSGKLTGDGGIMCGCEECNGLTEVPPSVFEEHSGSLAKKPADNIFLLRYGVSLKDLLTSVTSGRETDPDEGQCLLCGIGEELLHCEDCGCTFHAACCDWPELSAFEVPCPVCLMKEAAENVELRRMQQREEGAGDDSATESDVEMQDAVRATPAAAPKPLPLQLRRRACGAH